MKITYNFIDETVEIDVPEEWGEVLIELDRQEYNNNKKETRRNCSLDAYNADGNLVSDETDIEGDLFLHEDYKKLYEAIHKLGPWQRYLIEQVFFAGKKQNQIAAETGLGKAAISRAISRAKKNLYEFIRSM